MRIRSLLGMALLCGCGGPTWPGRYEGEFDGTYATTAPREDGKSELVRRTFSGRAWLEVGALDGDTAHVSVTDCETTWNVDGGEAILRADGEGSAECLLDVSGSVGVLRVRPTSGRAELNGDRLSLQYSAAGVPAEGSRQMALTTFRFSGKRMR